MKLMGKFIRCDRFFVFSSEQSYRMLCMIENHLSEGILFENQLIKPSEISTISIKQDCIQINPFPSNINQLISSIRTQLPKHISYKTVDSVRILDVEYSDQ